MEPRRWSLGEALEALRAWQPGPVRQLLETWLPDVTLAEWDVLESGVWWNAVDARERQASAAALRRILDEAIVVEGRGPVVLLYARFGVVQAWEQAWSAEALQASCTVAAAAWQGAREAAAPADRAAGDLVVAALDLLTVEIDVETASTSTDLGCWAALSEECVRQCDVLLEQLPADEHDPVRAELRCLVEEDRRYYAATAGAVRAADVASQREPGWVAALTAAIGELERAERGWDSRHATELRAHRQALQSLRAASDRPWLGVDRARAIAQLPFSFRHVDATELVAAARAHGADWALGGVPVVAVLHDLPVNDVWDSVDSLGRGYAGTALRLPEVYLVDDAGRARHTLRPQIWLSELGNHAVRLEFEVTDCSAHELFERLRVTCSEVGRLSSVGWALRSHVAGVEGGTWDSIEDMVTDTLDDLAVAARAAGSASARLVFTPSTMRTLVAIYSASSIAPDGTRTSVEDATTLPGLFGFQVLGQPIDTGTQAVAQWAAYPLSAVDAIEVPAIGQTLLFLTHNTSVIGSFNRPGWDVDVYLDLLAFAATLPGLFEAWNQELAAFSVRVFALLSEARPILAEPTISDDALAQLETIHSELQRRQLEIGAFIAGVRATMLFVTAPSLVSSPMLRAVMDQILREAGFFRMREQVLATNRDVVDAQVTDGLASLQRRFALAAEADRRRREHRARRVMEAVLAGVAVAGISGVASLIQAGYHVEELGTGLLVGSVALVSAAIAVLSWSFRERE